MYSRVAWVLPDPEAPGELAGSTLVWLCLSKQPAHQVGAVCFTSTQGHLPLMLFFLRSCDFWDFQNIPSLLGRMEDSFLRLPPLGMGMRPCPREGFWAPVSTRQAPMSLLGKREGVQGEECQRRLRNRSPSITLLGGPFESLAGFVLANICKRLRMPS